MKRYAIKDFSSWKMNEGLLRKLIDIAKELPGIKWLRGLFWNGKEFEGPPSTFLNNFTPDGQADLPKGVVVMGSNQDRKVLSEVGISVVEKPYFREEDAKFVQSGGKVQEAVVPLSIKSLGDTADKTIPDVSYARFKKDVLSHIMSMRRGVLLKKPVFCWGAPGLGKTAIIYQIAKELNMRVSYANLQNLLPEDILSPDPKRPGERKPAKWLPVFDVNAPDAKEKEEALNGENGGILFFDELPRAIKQTQESFIKFIDERQVDEFRLPSKWIMVAAGNRFEDDPESEFNLSSANARRFAMINLAPNPGEWLSWAVTQKDPDYPNEDLDYILPEIVAFISFKLDYFHRNDPEMGRLYPNPAAWRSVTSKVYAARKDAEELGVPFTKDDLRHIIAQDAGEHVLDEMDSFLELSQLTDLSKLPLVYSDPDKAPLPPKNKDGEYRTDIASAFLTNIALQKAKEDFTKSDFDNLAKYCLRLKKAPWIQTLITSLGLLCKSFNTAVKENDPISEDFALMMGENFPKIYQEIIELGNFDPKNIAK